MPRIYNRPRQPNVVAIICNKHKKIACKQPECRDRLAERISERANRAQSKTRFISQITGILV